MTDAIHYVELQADEAPGTEQAQEIMDEMFSVLHSTNHDGVLGFDIPSINPEACSVGNVFRVFGIKENVSKFLLHPRIQNMIGREEIEASDILQTPQFCTTVRLIRSRTDRIDGPSAIDRRLRRSLRRAESRGETICAKRAGEWRNKLESKASQLSCPGFNVKSGSNGHRYFIRVERVISNSICSSFNSYGFAKENGGIPSFH